MTQSTPDIIDADIELPDAPEEIDSDDPAALVEPPEEPEAQEECDALTVKTPTKVRNVLKKQGIRAARIDHICGLMANCVFRRRITSRQLAREWNLSLAYIHELTAEASKIVAAAAMDKGAVQAKVGSAIERILEQCIIDDRANDGKSRFTSEKTALMNRKLIIDAGMAWVAMSGAGAPKKMELTGADGGPLAANSVVASLSDAQIEELFRREANRIASTQKPAELPATVDVPLLPAAQAETAEVSAQPPAQE
jgi:hypothetical protein